MIYNFLRLSIIFFLVFLSGCSDNKVTEGNYIFDHTLESLNVGMTKEAVKDLVGPPTITASFNENIWYYAYETSTRKLRFLAKNIQDAKIIRLTFNEQNQIKRIDIITQKDFRKIPYDNDETITSLKKTKLSKEAQNKIDSF